VNEYWQSQNYGKMLEAVCKLGPQEIGQNAIDKLVKAYEHVTRLDTSLSQENVAAALINRAVIELQEGRRSIADKYLRMGGLIIGARPDLEETEVNKKYKHGLEALAQANQTPSTFYF